MVFDPGTWDFSRHSPIGNWPRWHRNARLAGVAFGPVGRLAGVADAFQQLFEHRRTSDANEHLLHLFARVQRFAIPGRDFAELQAADVRGAPFDQPTKVGGHESQALGPGGARAGVAAAQPGGKLAEEPRVGERSATNGDSPTAGFREHAGGIGDGAHVAAADDGPALDGFDPGPDAVELDPAAEALLARPAMNGDGRHANVLEGA